MVLGGHAPSSAVVGVTIALTTLAGVFAIGRLYTRIRVIHKAGADDFCIVLALLLTIALTICMCEQVNYGMGTHMYTLTPNDVIMSLKWFWASVWIYYLALCFTKLSILLQYLRVFPHNGFRVACFVLMGIIIVYSCCTFFTAMFECTPVPYFWNKSINGSCLNQTAIWFVNASINIVTDICTTVLPLPVLNTLRIPKREKYALMAVFSLGGFTCIISILRLQSLYVVAHTRDISWNNPLAAIWSSTEVNVGILCSCLPTLKGLLSRYYPTMFGTACYYSTRHSGPLENGHTSTVTSQPHELRSEGPAQELGEVKTLRLEPDAYVMDRIDQRNTAFDTYSPTKGPLPYSRSDETQSAMESEAWTRDDETTGSEAGSIQQNAPTPRLYQPM